MPRSRSFRSPITFWRSSRFLPETRTWSSWIAACTLSFVSLMRDRKSTRLNSSHVRISYAVFCLKKKKYKHSVSDAEEPENTSEQCFLDIHTGHQPRGGV